MVPGPDCHRQNIEETKKHTESHYVSPCKLNPQPCLVYIHSFFFFAIPCGMWDLSFPRPRIKPSIPAVEVQKVGPSKKSQWLIFNLRHYLTKLGILKWILFLNNSAHFSEPGLLSPNGPQSSNRSV